MPTHVPWPDIGLLHNVVRTIDHLRTLGDPDFDPPPVIRYRAKVKLHGTNAGVQILDDGAGAREVHAQSRNQMLTVTADHMGFAAWVASHDAYFRSLLPGTIFGEWCGPGVMKGMAISAVASKQFVVFGIIEGDRIIYDPEELRVRLPDPPFHILPWQGKDFVVDYGDRLSLEKLSETINAQVASVELEDPWVKATFGISGLGEGLVLYPILDGHLDHRMMFKAKGEKHRTVKSPNATQVDPTVTASIDAFVDLVVTDARLEQGLHTVSPERDPKQTGAFIGWVAKDVQKECAAELEAASLTWSQVHKAVSARARTWYSR